MCRIRLRVDGDPGVHVVVTRQVTAKMTPRSAAQAAASFVGATARVTTLPFERARTRRARAMHSRRSDWARQSPVRAIPSADRGRAGCKISASAGDRPGRMAATDRLCYREVFRDRAWGGYSESRFRFVRLRRRHGAHQRCGSVPVGGSGWGRISHIGTANPSSALCRGYLGVVRGHGRPQDRTAG